MRSLKILALGVLVTIPLCAPAGASEPVAIVYSLSGEASLAAPGTARRPLRLFDRLSAGTKVEVGTGSRVALAFVNGRRYELGEQSGVKIGTKDLVSRSGPVRTLPRVPPLPRLAPIAAEDRPGARAGAVRVRAERIAGLYPRDGAASLADRARLVFRPFEGVERYQVEVRDDHGRTIYQVEVDTSQVLVPTGILQPGTSYYWAVRTLDRPGAIAAGEAAFVTLPEQTSRSREALRAAIGPTGDGEAQQLLSAVDLNLGLLLEAREELRMALQKSPGCVPLVESLARLEEVLQADNPHVAHE
jgi:hypothetical protein